MRTREGPCFIKVDQRNRGTSCVSVCPGGRLGKLSTLPSQQPGSLAYEFSTSTPGTSDYITSGLFSMAFPMQLAMICVVTGLHML